MMSKDLFLNYFTRNNLISGFFQPADIEVFLSFEV